MTSSGVYLFLVWSRAAQAADSILRDLSANFEVLDVVDVVWSRELFMQNVARFYTTNLPPRSRKERECGTGPVRAIVVRDGERRYDLRMTSKGPVSVNARVFDAREKYRAWTGGGFKIHASLTDDEAFRDIRLLLDEDAARFMHSSPLSCLREVRRQECDLVGARGWKSLEQLMNALDAVTGCVLPFGSDSLESDGCEGSLNTMLVADRWDAVMVANGRPGRSRLHGRLMYEVDVSGRELWFDFRQIGEGYFDPAWERDMLARRVCVQGIPITSADDQLHARLYEDLVRPSKGQNCATSDLGKRRIERYFARLGYKFTTLQAPGVPVAGERMPLQWKVAAARNWLKRAGKSVIRRIKARVPRVIPLWLG